MDLELHAYLDKMNSDAIDHANEQDNISASILKALDTQMARIDSLATWKPQLKARFAKLDLSVSAFQEASPTATPNTGGSPHTPPPLTTQGSLHGQSSHGAMLLARGGGRGVGDPLESPAATPFTGMTIAPSMFPAPLSSQVLDTLSQPPPSMAFPIFTGGNQQL